MARMQIVTLLCLRFSLTAFDKRNGPGRGVLGWIPSFGNGVLPRPRTLSTKTISLRTKKISAINTLIKPSSKRDSRLFRKIQSGKEGIGEIDSFVDDIARKSAQEIEDEVFCRYYGKHVDGLARLLTGIQADIANRNEEDRNAMNVSKIMAKGFVKVLEVEQEDAKRSATGRVASITVGLDEDLKHDIDLQEFGRRVVDLFSWYNDNEMAIYIAPFFPMIQSSGSGKTRLFMAFREATKANTEVSYECKTVLCFPERSVLSVENRDVYYDETLLLQRRDDSTDKSLQRLRIRDQLQAFLSRSTKDRLVLLFDEAQFLLSGDDEVAFRCVRWWLREHRTKKVVAVFAGTTSELANFYRDSPAMAFSRNPEATTYVNWKRDGGNNPTKIYDPFFQICTIGCYHTDAPPDDNLSLSDFERAAFFGRPLFARLQKTNELVSPRSTLHAILKRMLLSESNWKENKAAVCSILGSRVQMGITTSFVFSSELVAKGYAHLVNFYQGEANDISKAVARISFMPDPVCAALAMGMMQENWKMALSSGDESFTGESKKFWSQQALVLLASGRCLPEKGNAGEIMAALYMLFCGDVLRHSKDRTMRTFSVQLTDWYSMMRDPNKESQHHSPSSHQASMDVNFIQVCRNYFRAHSWKTQKALEWMYKSAIALYVYPDCEAIDLVASVRVLRNGKPSLEMNDTLRCKLRVFGIAVEGPTNGFRDNCSVVTNGINPESTLKKRHNSITKNKVRKCVTAKALRTRHGMGKNNCSDVLTKFLPTEAQRNCCQSMLYR